MYAETLSPTLSPRCPAASSCPEYAEYAHQLWHEASLSEVKTTLEAVLKECPTCPDANLQLISCLVGQDRLEEADALIEHFLPLSFSPFYSDFLYLLKGQLLSDAFGPVEALPWFRSSRRGPASLASQARELIKQRRRTEAAELAEEALSLQPHDPGVVTRCVAVLKAANRWKALQINLIALAKLEGRVPAFYAAIVSGLLAIDDAMTAARISRPIARRFPESLSVTCIASQALLRSENVERAQPLLRRALKLDPVGHGRFALINLALSSGKIGRPNEMLSWSAEAYRQYPDSGTKKLLRNAIRFVTAEISKRDSVLQRMQAEYTKMQRDHADLEASLAGYDITEGGSNLEFALREGEGWHLEFMETWPSQTRDLGKEIAALASQIDGGTIFMGVDDNGRVTGVNNAQDLKGRDEWRHRIAQVASKVVQPSLPVTVYFNHYTEFDVVKIWIPEGPDPLYYVDGIAYIRNIDESRKATPSEVAEFIARRSNRHI